MMRPASPAPAGAPPADSVPDRRDQEKVWRRLDRLEEATRAQDGKIEALGEQLAKLKNGLAGEKKRNMNLTYALSTGVLMTANLTSNVGPGVWLAGGLRSGPLMLGIDLRAVLPSQVVVGPYDLDLSQLVGLLTPCGRYSVFFGCVVAGAGVQIGHDSNVGILPPGQSNTQSSPLVQLGGRLGVEVPLGESRFAVQGWGEVLYTTPSWEFRYNHGEFVTERPDVSAFFGLGFVVKLGEEQKGAK
jgi:hypothetical protein